MSVVHRTLHASSIINVLRKNSIFSYRYLIDDNRAIFMYKDGSLAWQAKDFLIEQERCESVTIESKVYEGKYKVRF